MSVSTVCIYIHAEIEWDWNEGCKMFIFKNVSSNV